MVEIGKADCFQLCSFSTRKKRYALQLGVVYVRSALAINEWHMNLEFIEQKEATPYLVVYSGFFFLVSFCSSDSEYRFANLYLLHPSKMDRHLFYSAAISPRLLSNTSLQHATH